MSYDQSVSLAWLIIILTIACGALIAKIVSDYIKRQRR